jgi:hypothetical protein
MGHPSEGLQDFGERLFVMMVDDQLQFKDNVMRYEVSRQFYRRLL